MRRVARLAGVFRLISDGPGSWEDTGEEGWARSFEGELLSAEGRRWGFDGKGV